MSERALILPGETHAPRLGAAQAQAVIAEHWGRQGAAATELGSYQDQVFRIDLPSGERLALKLANTEIGRDVLEMEHAVLRRIAGQVGPLHTPEPVPTLAGEELIETNGHLARVLTWVPGEPLAGGGFIDVDRARALGEAAGLLSAALSGLDHPGAHRALQWDVRQAAGVAEAAREHLTDDEWAMQQRALGWLAGVDDASLPRQIAYTDVTANNLLGHLASDGTFTPTAVVDFGDTVHTWRLSDPVGAAFSAVAGDPALALQLAMASLAAFHAHQPLTELEADAFWPVLAGRAALCAASSAWQARAGASASSSAAATAYLDTFLARDDAALRAILAVEPTLARAAARAACSLPPATCARSVAAAITDLQPGPLVDGLTPAALRPVDLSAGSPLLTGGVWDDAEQFTAALAQASTPLPVGRWGEERLVGAGLPATQAPTSLHLGADLFLPAGTMVLAPYAVRVASVGADWVELEATTPASPAATAATAADTPPPAPTPLLRLAGLRPGPTLVPGASISRGAGLGTIAEPAPGAPVPAHLHVQLAITPGLPTAADPALRDAWLALCPDPSPLLGADVSAPAPPPAATLVARRDRVVASAQGLYYREPAEIVRGWRQYLYDASGRPYLDMVNNVAAIGHSHPAVARAATEQLHLLNTNSRFLYGAMAEFAEAITATLPPHLSTVFFVNSGSEALDLAVLIARAATGRKDLVTIGGAYHGWTGAVLEFCTHPQDNPRWAQTIPPWIHPVPQPNPYRGELGPHAGPYVDAVRDACEAAQPGGGVAAFVAEPLLGNAGAITPPPGFLKQAYAVAREHGGLCIADEVQVGYARTGETFWAFEHEGVDPDIVACAKAVGNGHPLGFVACRPELAAEFGAHASWFSSPGGGPVSCRIGLAVLGAIESEGLQANAAKVGAHLKARLEALAAEHPIIGKVNGRGLYMGVDLVRDRGTLEPAPGEATAICERLRRYGVILQPTGDHANVLKVKPPLCLTTGDADFFADQLGRVLDERASSL